MWEKSSSKEVALEKDENNNNCYYPHTLDHDALSPQNCIWYFGTDLTKVAIKKIIAESQKA